MVISGLLPLPKQVDLTTFSRVAPMLLQQADLTMSSQVDLMPSPVDLIMSKEPEKSKFSCIVVTLIRTMAVYLWICAVVYTPDF